MGSTICLEDRHNNIEYADDLFGIKSNNNDNDIVVKFYYEDRFLKNKKRRGKKRKNLNKNINTLK